MTEHPNAKRLRDAYEAFSRGDIAALDALFDEKIRWTVPGNSRISGSYEGRSSVYEMFGRISEVTEGTFRTTVRTVLADDNHGVVVTTHSADRGTGHLEANEAHLWRFDGDRAVEFLEFTSEPDALDAMFR